MIRILLLLGCSLGLSLAAAWAGGTTESLLSQTGSICLRAEKPADLNELSTKLSRAGNAAAAEGLERQLEVAQQFVAAWKEYLTAKEAKNSSASRSILENLLASPNWLFLMPRSEVLDRTAEDPSISSSGLVIPCERWSDFAAALKILTDSADQIEDREAAGEALLQMQKLQELSGELGSKDWDKIASGCQIKWNDPVYLQSFKQLLMIRVITGFLRLDRKYESISADGEKLGPFLKKLGPFLKKLEKEARRNKDWISLWRILAYQRENNLYKTPFQLDELKSLDAYLAGLRYENPSQADKAGLKYRSALTLPLTSDLLEAIVQRIVFLQENFPDQWAKVSRQTNTPPSINKASGSPFVQIHIDSQNKNDENTNLWTRY